MECVENWDTFIKKKKNTWAFKKTMLSDEKFKITIYCMGTMNSSGNRSEDTSKFM